MGRENSVKSSEQKLEEVVIQNVSHVLGTVLGAGNADKIYTLKRPELEWRDSL